MFKSPSFQVRTHFFRYKGSVIPRILPSTILVTVVAVVVTVLYQLTSVKLSIDQTFINVIGIVIGLLLAYRVTVAYERNCECVNQWRTLSATIRSMSMIIWTNVKESTEETSDIREKKTALNLLVGFAIATMHFLRKEDGLEFDDLVRRIPDHPIFYEYDKTEGHHAPLPIIISSCLLAYFRKLSENGKADDYTLSILYENLVKLLDIFSNLEKIIYSSRPISIAYSIHITQTVWIYCLALPFQLVANSGWVAIPLVFLMAFILLGAHKIGKEIENPFGYDYNDIDLHSFCSRIERESNYLMSHKPTNFEDLTYAEKLVFSDVVEELKTENTSFEITNE